MIDCGHRSSSRYGGTAAVAIAVACVAASVASQERPAADKVACAGTPDRYPEGQLRRCELSADATLAGLTVPAGSQLTFGPDGVPGMAILSRTAPIYGQPLPANTVLHIADGRLHHFWLPADTEIQGHLVRGQDDGAGARLHPNGRLLAIWLAKEEVINGVPCTSSANVLRMGLGVIRLGTKRMAWFRPDGRLQQCMLSRDITLDGHPMHKGDVLSLDVNGHTDPSAEKLSRW
jgi:hypothetical protein